MDCPHSIRRGPVSSVPDCAPSRAVGVVIDTRAGLRVASFGPKKCFRLDDPFEIMDAYTRVGVARVFEDPCEIAEVQRFCERFVPLERSDAPYTFSSIVLGPLHLMARRLPSGPLRTVLFLAVVIYCYAQRLRYRGGRGSYVCSTFAWAAVHHARRAPLRLPLSAHPEDEAAYATASTSRDDLLARWLCGPTELWQALSPTMRSELDLQSFQVGLPVYEPVEEVIIDLGALEIAGWSEGEVVIDLRNLGVSDSFATVGPEIGINPT